MGRGGRTKGGLYRLDGGFSGAFYVLSARREADTRQSSLFPDFPGPQPSLVNVVSIIGHTPSFSKLFR